MLLGSRKEGVSMSFCLVIGRACYFLSFKINLKFKFKFIFALKGKLIN